MSTGALSNEDLEDVALVRMEDVQPSRSYDVISRRKSDDEVLEMCVIENIEYDNECIVGNDEDSNIGSMVYIQAEDDDIEAETIVPDILDVDTEPAQTVVLQTEERKPPSSWPTLEILPGGVIKYPEQIDDSICPSSFGDMSGNKEMVYACAKCPQRFKFLFCLVKHVKGHEDEAKKKGDNYYTYTCRHRTNKTKLASSKKLTNTKTNRKRYPKKLKS